MENKTYDAWPPEFILVFENLKEWYFFNMDAVADSEIPKDRVRHKFLGEIFNIQDAISDTPLKRKQDFYQFSCSKIDIEGLASCSYQSFEKYGWYGFLDPFSSSNKRGKSYGGLGLTYNTNFIDTEAPRMRQVFDSRRVNLPEGLLNSPSGRKIYFKLMENKLEKEFFYTILPLGLSQAISWLQKKKMDEYVFDFVNEFPDQVTRKANFQRQITLNMKNNYPDSYGFTSKTEVLDSTPFKGLLSLISRTVVRSRIAELRSEFFDVTNKHMYSHRDEIPFLELRLVIPIYMDTPRFGLNIDEKVDFLFKTGEIYSWDTSLPHRQYAESTKCGRRLNIIIGISPWIDFLSDSSMWVPNKFFGKKHPFDMLVDGDIISNLNLL